MPRESVPIVTPTPQSAQDGARTIPAASKWAELAAQHRAQSSLLASIRALLDSVNLDVVAKYDALLDAARPLRRAVARQLRARGGR